MPGQITIEPSVVPLSTTMQPFGTGGAIPVGQLAVYVLAGGTYHLLPYVRLISDTRKLGADPGQANLSYSMGDLQRQLYGWPSRFEQVWGLYAPDPLRVGAAVRVCAFNHLPSGLDQLLFDGWVTAEQLSLGEGEEQVVIQASGAPSAEWDYVIGGAIYRDSHTCAEIVGAPAPNDEAYYQTDGPARFNPDGRPNRTPDWVEDLAWPWDGLRQFTIPAFVDQDVRNPRDIQAYWTLADAVKYCVGSARGGLTSVVRYDAIWTELDAILSTVESVDGDSYDPSDPDTYTLEPIRAPDMDVTGMVWPEAVQRLIEPHGYSLMFRYRLNNGYPEWQMDIVKRFAPTVPKSLWLQPAGVDLDPGLTNLAGADLTLDLAGVVNEVTLDSAPNRFQITAVLAPAFEVDYLDASKLDKFVEGSTTAEGPEDLVKYREFVLDEAGEGHWDIYAVPTPGQWVEGEPVDLTPVFSYRTKTSSDGKYHAVRRRRPLAELLETVARTDADLEDGVASVRERAKARLWIADRAELVFDDYPGLYLRFDNEDDPAYTPINKQLVADGQWELLKDRVGIRITCQDPNDWNIGEQKDDSGDLPFADGKVPVVECMATPNAPNMTQFVLILECVIEADQGVYDLPLAPWRPVSPVDYKVQRRLDARDSVLNEFLDISAINRPDYPGDPETLSWATRYDVPAAQRQAESYRASNEVPTVAGSATFFGLVRDYLIGDRIDGVAGRGASFRLDRGLGGAPDARYPHVVGIDTSYEGAVETTIHLEDFRGAAAQDPLTRKKLMSLSAMERAMAAELDRRAGGTGGG